MKIGIITFHASLNCGSMLQAYALQEVLQTKYGAQVEIINYSNLGQRNYYASWDFYPRPSVMKNNLKLLFNHDVIKKVRMDYKEFQDEFFNIKTPLLKRKSQLNHIDDNYDIVIAGGDQVWNVRCRDADKTYFLSFVQSALKVAYSPSLGARNINKVALNPKAYADLIKDFDFLSVRENNGQKWLKELTGIDVPIVADPTVLMNEQQWSKCLNLQDIDEDFIVFYAFSYANEKNNLIMQEVMKKTGLPIYIIDAKSWTVNRLDQYGIKLWNKAGPVPLLNLMKSAKLAFVQSFHGIVFSALFHKTFWSLRNSTIKNPDDDRAKVILEQTGLQSRAITYDELLTVDLFKEVEYESVDIKMQEMREDAFKYIDSFMKK